MATFRELGKDYGFLYAFWAVIEYKMDGIVSDFAKRQMNKISLKVKGKEVFQLS